MDIELLMGRHIKAEWSVPKLYKALSPYLDGNKFIPIYSPTGSNIPYIALYPFLVAFKHKEGNIIHASWNELSHIQTNIELHPMIAHTHDMIPYTFYHDDSFSGLRGWYYRKVLKGMKHCDRFITPSEAAKKELIQLLAVDPDLVSVIHNGIDHSKYFPKRDRSILGKYGIGDRLPVILMVGSEQPRKDTYTALGIFAKIKEEFPQAILVKVGDPHGKDWEIAFKAASLTHGIEKDIIRVGNIPEEEVPKFYNASDLLLFPSRIEGFGLPPVEAMSCGIPVITTNIPTSLELYGEAAILGNPGDSFGMGIKAIELLKDKDLWEEYSKRGIEQAKKYDIRIMAKKLIELWESVLRN